MAEFEVDKDVLERMEGSNETYSCSSHGGAAERGALGPFGLLVLTDDEFSEQTPIYFYLVKDVNGNLTTFFCADHLKSSRASDVRKLVHGSNVPVLNGEKLTMRILVIKHACIYTYIVSMKMN